MIVGFLVGVVMSTLVLIDPSLVLILKSVYVLIFVFSGFVKWLTMVVGYFLNCFVSVFVFLFVLASDLFILVKKLVFFLWTIGFCRDILCGFVCFFSSVFEYGE